VVDAVSEGQVRVGGTGGVELLRMLEVPRITVGCEQRGWLEAQDLFDELGDPGGLCAE
jgi:hypothetical protein